MMPPPDEAATPAHVAALKGSMKAPSAPPPEEGGDDNAAMLGEICDALTGLSSEPGTDPQMADALMQACKLIEPFAAQASGGDQGAQEESETAPSATDGT